MSKSVNHVTCCCSGQHEGLKENCDKLVETNNEMFSMITTGLLPTPAKSHYTFNLRDLSKVYQGILMFDAAKLNVRVSALAHRTCLRASSSYRVRVFVLAHGLCDT